MAGIATLVVEMRANTALLAADLSKARRVVEQTSGQMATAFGAVRTALRGIGVTLGAVGVARGIQSMVNASLEFESSFAGVRKTVNATEPELQTISSAFIQMSKEIPVTTTELNKIGEAAGQLGIETKNIVKFSRVMADLGATTNLTSDEAATSLARLANITQLPEENFDRLASVIVELGNNMATTESEIVAMGLRLAGAGKQIGLTEGQTLAFAAALSSVGIEAEAGGSSISKVFIQIAQSVANGNAELATFASVAGLGTQEFAKAFKDDAAGAIISFVEGLGRISASGGNVFKVLENLGITEVRMRDALLRASGAGDLLRTSLDLQGKAWSENNALTEEAGKRYATAQSQLTLFKNKLTDVGKQLGDVIVPEMIKFLEATESVIGVLARAKVAAVAFITAFAAQQIIASAAAIKTFGNALAAVQILGAVRSFAGLRLALLAIVPAAGAALAALNTLVIPAAIAAFAQFAVELYRTGKAQQELHDTNVQLSQVTTKLANDLKSKYGVEIARAGKTLEEWNKEVLAAALVHTGLADQIKAAAEAARLKAESDAKAAQGQAAANVATAEQSAELKNLVAQFNASLRPADALNTELAKLSKEGKSSAEMLKVYGEEISQAVEKQREFGFPIPALISNLEAMRQKLQDVAIALEADTVLGDLWSAMLRGMADGSLAAATQIGVLQKALDATRDELDKLQAIGEPAEMGFVDKAAEDMKELARLQAIFLAESGNVQGALDKLTFNPFLIQIPSVKRGMEELAKTGEQIGHAISSGIEDAIQHWEGFRNLAIGVLNDIAATILRNAVIAPLTKWLGDFFGDIVGSLGGLGGGANAPVHLAKGGKPPVGRPSIVGEKGPELFIPEVAGWILPNSLTEMLKRKQGDDQPDAVSGWSLAAPTAAASGRGGFGGMVGRMMSELLGEFSNKSLNTRFNEQLGTLRAAGSQFREKFSGSSNFFAKTFSAVGEKLQGLTPRAMGGPVSSGGRYLVGERGPEMFVAPSAGRVIPNGEGLGTQTVIQYNIDARGAGPGVGEEIRRALANVEDRAVNRAVRTVQELKLRTT